MCESLYHAVKLDRLDVLQQLITEGHDVNQCFMDDEYGGNLTPLQKAAQMNKLEMVKILLDKGADINHCNKSVVSYYMTRDSDGVPYYPNGIDRLGNDKPVQLAMQNRHREVVKYLVERGAELTGLFYIAAKYGDICDMEYLIGLDQSLDNDNECYGRTPLFGAVQTSLENTKFLLEHDANVNATNSFFHETPIFGAVRSENIEIVKLLIEYGASVVVENMYEVLISFPIRSNNMEMVKLLQENGAITDDCNALSWACLNLDVLRYFISKKVSLESYNCLHENVLIEAVGRFSLKNLANCLPLLLDNGIDINSTGNTRVMQMRRWGSEITAVSKALNLGRLDIAKLLLLYGADITKGELFRINEKKITLMYLAGCPVSSIRSRLSADVEEHITKYMYNLERTPLSLREHCRIFLRIFLGKKYIMLVKDSELPYIVRYFLTFSDIEE